ncbi:glucose-6-phosphate isomerase [Micromonospora sp. C28ISP2-4]|uniref:glucose-6-phosphate isomerase n=1 Tax=Micromonospora sp. C28ISP2-4 TaxID=3059523 RepID=UPI0026757385|nr:glucose-6-phosphate isomerase [Micromonospora sp. C28ISP2-4]MDO3687198.1 glucose-6-phosphate isomerase [Micromonospora sp. C28ISP2-4]
MSDLLAGRADMAAGLAVRGADAVGAAARATLVSHDVPARLAAADPALWGPAAEPAALARLGWLHAHRHSRDLLPQLAELAAELDDLDHVVLAGDRGDTLAAEVVAECLGRPVTVLDTADPGPVRAALGGDRPARTLLVLAARRGLDRTTDAHLRAYRQAWADEGPDAARHVVVVTEPGSELAARADELGAVVIPAEPGASGPWAALTAFGLVPAALAGAPVAEVLDEAEALTGALDRDRDNPALALGAALGAAPGEGRDTIALVPDGTGLDGLGRWAGALLADATAGRLLPVVAESPDSPGATGPGVLTVGLGGALGAGVGPGVAADVAVNGPLGAHLLTWAYAAATAAVTLRTDPFAAPAAAPVDDEPESGPPSSVEGAIEVYAPSDAPADLTGALRRLLDGLGEREHLVVTAYLDRHADAAVAGLRQLLARAAGRPVTFGWGPHRPQHTDPHGRHLQITGAVTDDLAVPGRPYTFAQLQAAQAAGDRRALARRERPVLRLHLTERAAGVAQLLDTAGRTRT